MRTLLLEGKGSIEAVARIFSMHRRTLDRHLGASGFSFREVADEIRFEVACQLLRDTRLTVNEIAASLHYGDASAFAHAFRRWSRQTPSEWRESVNGTKRVPRIGARADWFETPIARCEALPTGAPASMPAHKPPRPSRARSPVPAR